jgi:hypothetical protein
MRNNQGFQADPNLRHDVLVMTGQGRKISECIALARAYEEKLGHAPMPDPGFAKDVQAAIDAQPEPLNPPAWG